MSRLIEAQTLVITGTTVIVIPGQITRRALDLTLLSETWEGHLPLGC
ncbi:hypothetical protein [Thermofilum sp.]|nr:hypothetical protein [Thermofilum sp.]